MSLAACPCDFPRFVSPACPSHGALEYHGGGWRVVDTHPTLRLAINHATGASAWVSVLPLCPACVAGIGGAHAGPDAPWRPASPGEPCGAADCAGGAL